MTQHYSYKWQKEVKLERTIPQCAILFLLVQIMDDIVNSYYFRKRCHEVRLSWASVAPSLPQLIEEIIKDFFPIPNDFLIWFFFLKTLNHTFTDPLYLITVNVTEISDKIPVQQEGINFTFFPRVKQVFGFQFKLSKWYQLSPSQMML